MSELTATPGDIIGATEGLPYGFQTPVRSDFQGQAAVLTEVAYLQPGVGYFPSFSGQPAIHGFSWGAETGNMSYRYHTGDRSIVTGRQETFLRSVGMAPLSEAVHLVAPAFTTGFLTVDQHFLAVAPRTGEGCMEAAQAAFTTVPGVPLCGKPGDCNFSIFSGETARGEALVGLMHTGRWELENQLPLMVMKQAVAAYGCDPKDLRVGITPGISARYHTVRPSDVPRLLTPAVWGKHLTIDQAGTAYLDDTGLLTEQLQEAGIQPDHLEIYEVDTYEAAIEGTAFSHRYSLDSNDPTTQGRGLVAVQLQS